MDLKGSKTRENLIKAFESKAHQKNMYDSYAYRFAYTGHQQIQNALYDAAKVEGTHARVLYELLYGSVGDTLTNFRKMLEDERTVGAEMYNCAQIAKAEGFEDAAAVFEETAKVHDDHINTYEQIVFNLENDKVFNKDEAVDWVCIACGVVIHGKSPEETCPYCEHPKGLFYIRTANF